MFFRKNNNEPNPFGIETSQFKNLQMENLEDKSTISQTVLDQEVGGKSGGFLGLTISLRRMKLCLILTLFVIGILFAKAAHLQIIQGSQYRSLAEGNRIRIESIQAARGVVYDRNQNLLIENVPAFTVTLTDGDIPDSEREQVLDDLADILNMPRGEIEALLEEYKDVPYEPVPIARGVGHERAMAIASQQQTLPGTDLTLSTLRSYATDAARSLSHVLGFLGKISPDEIDTLSAEYRRTDEIGKQGIEEAYETELRGQSGQKVVEVDARGFEAAIITEKAPVDGTNITLSIDADLQSFIEMRLLENQETSGDNKAAVVALDPNNGEVLALVSLPTFDSNDFSGGNDSAAYGLLINDESQPLFPRAISCEYHSGSTFKPIVAAAALSEGLISEYTSFLSEGGIAISSWFFPDWKAGGHGMTDVRKAIAESVNTFFYIIGGGLDDFVGLGVARITKYAAYFGLGSLTGIEIAGEAEGFLPSKEWKMEYKNERWYVGDTYHLAIGQGDILVTPLQIASMTSVFANGGMLYQPHLLHDAESEGSNVNEKVGADSIRIVSEGMRQAVTEGSARYLLTVTEPVAGKTGTAQTGGDKDYHAWFTGFGPYEDPEIVLTILVEEGGGGSEVSVPIARDIFNWWFANR